MSKKILIVTAIVVGTLVGIPVLCICCYLGVQIHDLERRPSAESLNRNFDKSKFESALSFLQSADRMFVYSVIPESGMTENWLEDLQSGGALDSSAPNPKKSKAILGHTEIKDQKLRAEIVSSATNSFDPRESGALCFEPRHVIIAQKGQEKLVFVICFECLQALIFNDKDTRLMVGTGSRNIFKSSSVAHLLELLNGALKSAGVKLPSD